MKLSVAVGILSANSLPAVVSETRSSDGQQLWTTSKTKDRRRLAIDSTRSNGLGLRPSSDWFMNGALWKSASHGSTINAYTECIPDESTEADVGALGCGSGQICVARVDSILGGRCKRNTAAPLTGRSLQEGTVFDFCDPTSSYNQLDSCDCSSFDSATKTGSISCFGKEPYCLGSLYYGCYNTCLSTAKTFSFENGESISIDICEELVTTGEVTGPSSLCTYFSGDYETCETTLDGQQCTSCTTAYPEGNSFDCSNVADGVKGGLEEQTMWFANHPMIRACHTAVDGTYCNLCGDDFVFDLENNAGTVISLDGFEDALTCAGLLYANSYNKIPSDRCLDASAVAKADCCVDRWYVQGMIEWP